jgi:hypothetical protein
MKNKFEQLTAKLVDATDTEIDFISAYLRHEDGYPIEILVDKVWKPHAHDLDMSSGELYRPIMRHAQPPWEVIDPKFNWFAMDEDGSFFFYENKPNPLNGTWLHGEDNDIMISEGLVFPNGNQTWDESCVNRPNVDENGATVKEWDGVWKVGHVGRTSQGDDYKVTQNVMRNSNIIAFDGKWLRIHDQHGKYIGDANQYLLEPTNWSDIK